MTAGNQTYAAALNQALNQAMAEDTNVILLGEDISESVFGVTSGLREIYGPKRVMDMPISETAFVGMAVGAAMTGLRPVVEIMFNDFMGVCFDQILNQAAKARFLSGGRLKLPLVIRTTMGAGDSSGAMHSQSLAHLVTSIAGLKVVMPSNGVDAAGLLLTALADDGPVVFIEHKGLYGDLGAVTEEIIPIPFGEVKVIRSGSDMTVVATSAMVKPAVEAAEQLGDEGIHIEIIDPRTTSPLDLDSIIASVAKTGRLLVVDEGAARCGIAADIAAQVQAECFKALKAPIAMVTPPHTPVPYAPAAENAWLPQVSDILQAAKRLMAGN